MGSAICFFLVQFEPKREGDTVGWTIPLPARFLDERYYLQGRATSKPLVRAILVVELEIVAQFHTQSLSPLRWITNNPH